MPIRIHSRSWFPQGNQLQLRAVGKNIMGKKKEHGNECWVSMPAGKMLRIGLSESDFFTISLKNFK